MKFDMPALIKFLMNIFSLIKEILASLGVNIPGVSGFDSLTGLFNKLG